MNSTRCFAAAERLASVHLWFPADEAQQARRGESGVVEAYSMSLDADAHELMGFAATLSGEERRRANAYRSPAEASRYVVRRGRLRELLAARLGCEPGKVPLSRNAFGKPFVQGSDLRFNLSYSCGHVLYVIARGFEVGCDIESRQPHLATREVADRFFSARELRQLSLLPQNEWTAAFFDCWTRKEALIKALGLGLSYPLGAFDVSVAPGDRAVLLRGPAGWSIHVLELENRLHAAIAANRLDWTTVTGA